MPSIIFDYDDIASRMKGDLKPCKKPAAVEPDSEPAAAKIGFLKTKVKKKPAPIVSDDDDDDDDI